MKITSKVVTLIALMYTELIKRKIEPQRDGNSVPPINSDQIIIQVLIQIDQTNLFWKIY